MCDIISTLFMISYPLCMTSQTCALMTPHSAYVWHHLRYKRRHIHSITANHSVYNVTPTSGITSHALYQTSHLLYLCYHNLSPDITATFLWHQTHYMCDIICSADDIASTLSHKTTLFMMSHPLQAWYHTPCIRRCTTVSLSSQPLHWYHTHFWMTSNPSSVWHHMHYI